MIWEVNKGYFRHKREFLCVFDQIIYFLLHFYVTINDFLVRINMFKTLSSLKIILQLNCTFIFDLLGFSLCSNTFDGFSDGFFVTQELHRNNGFKVLVQFVHKWNTSWEIQSHDLFVCELIQMLDNAA